MKTVGRIESLWRYPVKSMRGEALEEAYVGFAGVYGDRLYAFLSSAARKAFPYLTGREQEQMLLYRPAYRHRTCMAEPPSLAETEANAPGLTPLYPTGPDLMVDVETPAGETLAIDDPGLITMLQSNLRHPQTLTLRRSDRAMTDCRPISLISLETIRQLGSELGVNLDKRRFRANIYVDLQLASNLDGFVGQNLQVGAKAVIAVIARDPRCKMVTLDPDTAETNPEIMRLIARTYEGKVGVYGAVLVEGIVRVGDEIALTN